MTSKDNVTARIIEKNNLLKTLRDFLYDKNFIEVITPITRKFSSELFPRVQFNNEKYLRDSIEMALRYKLKHYAKIFEIGQCFRNDRNGLTHSEEFLMLELYAINEDIDYLISLCVNLINTLNPDLTIEKISVSGFIKNDLNVDLRYDSDDQLKEAIINKYNFTPSKHNFEVINKYIERYIEPMSHGKCMIFQDYPRCTISIARLKDGTTSIINRFELFINNVEVMHGYEDENDLELFKERAQEVNLFNEEEKIIYSAIKNGDLSPNTAGLGIGIERLCMGVFNSTDIQKYIFSKIFA